MGMKILKRDGTVLDVSDEQLADIAEHTKGRTLAEIAAEPPRFAHLLDSKPKPVGIWRRFWGWLRPKKKADPWPKMSREHLERCAWTFGVEPSGTNEELRDKITARLRGQER